MYCEETQCSAISATRNWCFTRWSSAKQHSIAVAVLSSVCWESYYCLVCGVCMFQSRPWGFFSARSAVWRLETACRWEYVWKVCMICNGLATCLGWILVCCWDRHEQTENNRLSEPYCRWRRNVRYYPWYCSNCALHCISKAPSFSSGDQQSFPKLNTNIPMGSCTGLVILQILISSCIVWSLFCSPYHCIEIPWHRVFEMNSDPTPNNNNRV